MGITRSRPRKVMYGWCLGFAALIVTFGAVQMIHGQEGTFSSLEMYTSGQNIAPVFDGWEQNPDGSFNMVFGYFNRNWKEQPVVPIGPNNNIEPGGPDQGQPTHFFPRRNRFVFRVKVPKDFGKKEIVWTLIVHGKTERAYATLHPDYFLDADMLQRNYVGTTPARMNENKPPIVTLEGAASRVVKVGEPLMLTALVTDDGLLKPRATPRVVQGQEPGYIPALGLRVAWYVYRGAADKVTFDPEQIEIYPDYTGNSPFASGWLPPPVPADGKFSVQVRFTVPGTYVLQVLAHDGGFGVTRDVTVTVN